MSNAGPLEIAPPVACRRLFFSLITVLVIGASAYAGDRVGFLSERGRFVPKAEITRKGPAIIVRKLNPADKFASLRVRFIYPGVEKPGAMRGLSIQWEKQPHRMGRRWPLNVHRRFNPAERTLETSWSKSLAFVLRDSSDKPVFRGLPWERVIEIQLDGKPLKKQPPEPEPKIAAPAERGSSQATASPAVARPARPDPPPAPRVQPEKPVENTLKEIRVNQETLKRDLDALSQRVSDVEHAVAVAQRWFYWGPLLALTLSILFSSVALFLTFSRLSRGRRPPTLTSPRYDKVRLNTQNRFRRLG